MTGLVLCGVLLLAAVVALISAPLLRPPAVRTHRVGAVYRDQLAELEREVAEGLLVPVEAEPARREIARRLLAAAGDPEPVVSSPPLPGLALVVAVAVGGGAVGLYLLLGTPGG